MIRWDSQNCTNLAQKWRWKRWQRTEEKTVDDGNEIQWMRPRISERKGEHAIVVNIFEHTLWCYLNRSCVTFWSVATVEKTASQKTMKKWWKKGRRERKNTLKRDVIRATGKKVISKQVKWNECFCRFCLPCCSLVDQSDGEGEKWDSDENENYNKCVEIIFGLIIIKCRSCEMFRRWQNCRSNGLRPTKAHHNERHVRDEQWLKIEEQKFERRFFSVFVVRSLSEMRHRKQ